MFHHNEKGSNMVVEKHGIRRLLKLEWAGFLVFLLAVILVKPAFAQELSITPYAHSTISSSETFTDEDYLVPNSVPKRINNQLRIENELRVDVTGLKETYRINDGHTTDQAFNHYLSELKKLNAKVLYQCSSRDCGRSSSWAQNIFNNSKLYGEDASQFFLSAIVQQQEQQWLISLYTVERGNRRVYAHIETLKLNTALASELASTSSTDANPIFVFSYGANGMVSINPKLAEINQIIELYRADTNTRLFIVGHMQQGDSSPHKAMSQSEEAANQVASLLKKRGVDGARLSVIGVGPLIPYGQGVHSGNRVEVTVVSE